MLRRALAAAPAVGLLLSGGAVAEAAPAAGNARPFALDVSATLAQDGTTDLALAVTSSDAAYAAPSTFKHVQLKSYDTAGELVWTKNVKDVPAAGGSATLVRDDLEAGQPIKVQVQVQTPGTKNTHVVEAVAEVERRPDLAFESVDGPEQVIVGTDVQISAVVRELNGDLGATASIELDDNGTVVDSVSGVEVPAGMTAGALLAVHLDEPGVHELTLTIDDVDPEEWDGSNNTIALEIEVIEPDADAPMSYWASYSSESGENHSTGSTWYSWWSYHDTWSPREWFSASYYSPDDVTPAGTFDVEIATENGVVETVHLTDVNLNNYWYDPVTGTQVQIQSHGHGTYVYVYHSAGNWWYSRSYCDYYYYGYCSSYDGASSSGVIWNAQDRLSVDVALPSNDGTTYGGAFELPLTPYHSSWDYSWWDYYGYWYHWGWSSGYSGSASGQTT